MRYKDTWCYYYATCILLFSTILIAGYNKAAAQKERRKFTWKDFANKSRCKQDFIKRETYNRETAFFMKAQEVLNVAQV